MVEVAKLERSWIVYSLGNQRNEERWEVAGIGPEEPLAGATMDVLGVHAKLDELNESLKSQLAKEPVVPKVEIPKYTFSFPDIADRRLDAPTVKKHENLGRNERDQQATQNDRQADSARYSTTKFVCVWRPHRRPRQPRRPFPVARCFRKGWNVQDRYPRHRGDTLSKMSLRVDQFETPQEPCLMASDAFR